MKFYSTRDNEKKKFDSAFIIKQGLADDGGLFIPESIPALTEADIKDLCTKSYPERAAKILLDEFRGAKLGNISLEKPADFVED